MSKKGAGKVTLWTATSSKSGGLQKKDGTPSGTAEVKKKVQEAFQRSVDDERIQRYASSQDDASIARLFG